MERKQKTILGTGLVFLCAGITSCHQQATRSSEALRTQAQQLALLIDAPQTQHANQVYRDRLVQEYQRIQHDLVNPSAPANKTLAYWGAASIIIGLTLNFYALAHTKHPIYT